MTSYDALIDDLLSHSYADTREAKTATALDLVLEGDVDGLRLFLQQQQQPRKDAMLGFQVNARSPTTGRSLLHEACAEGQMEIVKLLLERTDADLMLRTMLGRSSPLHLAVTNNHRAVAFLLLSHGADALCRDRFGSSPMHYVKSLSVAKLLVQYGGQILDYNSKRKNALENVLVFAESGSVEDDAARRNLEKFLKHQAELEYKAKLTKFRDLKQQAKAQSASLSERRKSPTRKLRKKLEP